MRSLVLLTLVALAPASPLHGGYGKDSAPETPAGGIGAVSGGAGDDDVDKVADDTAAAIGLKPFTFPMGAVFPAHQGLANGQDLGSEYGGGGPLPNGASGAAKYYGVVVPVSNGQTPEQPVSGQGQPGGGLSSGRGGSGTGGADDDCVEAKEAPIELPPGDKVEPLPVPKDGYGDGTATAPVEPPPPAPNGGTGGGNIGGQQNHGAGGKTSEGDSGSGYRKRL